MLTNTYALCHSLLQDENVQYRKYSNSAFLKQEPQGKFFSVNFE